MNILAHRDTWYYRWRNNALSRNSPSHHRKSLNVCMVTLWNWKRHFSIVRVPWNKYDYLSWWILHNVLYVSAQCSMKLLPCGLSVANKLWRNLTWFIKVRNPAYLCKLFLLVLGKKRGMHSAPHRRDFGSCLEISVLAISNSMLNFGQLKLGDAHLWF